MRLRLFLALSFVASTACQPAENAVLIDVYTQAGISDLRVIVLSLDDTDTWTDPYEPINMTAEEINADPLQIVVELGAVSRVLVQIEARGSDGTTRLVATRCYAVDGIVRDDVRLVVVGGDIDMDGFVVDPATVCREQAMDGGERTCDPALDHVCPDDRASDCNDNDATFHPGAGIVCLDGMDQDCDGDIDEACADLDGDGHDSCPMAPMGPCDCNDSVESINPDAPDLCNDGIDQDCSGSDACCDADEDMFCTCLSGEPGPECLGLDCNDADANARPGVAEVCDGIDNDCNGIADELDECRGDDLDGDGVPHCGREEPGQPCDCNDCDAAIYPGAREVCSPRIGAMGNTIDEDCDGTPDDGCPAVDADGDGYGANDCRDDDPWAFPHQNQEVQVDRCGDGQASTCIPGDPDTSCADDLDGDGFTEPAACENNPAIRPNAMEVCNGFDDDCDGVLDEVLDPANLTGCGVSIPIDFTRSFTDCGSCRSACSIATANECRGSACICNHDPSQAECPPGRDCCGDPDGGPDGGCVDLATNTQHCGACGVTCAAGETCTGGTCMCGAGPACGAGRSCCGGSCIDPTTDPANCGGCGIVCGTDNTECNVGSCRCVDGGTQNWEDCDGDLGAGGNGCEVDVNSDPLHCGGCVDRACSTNHAIAACSGGNCAVTCDVGFGNCDGDARTNGCENSLDSLSHCGTCGVGCSITNASETCAGDVCRVAACEGLFGDCNNDMTSCETPLNTLANCGNCGQACTVTGGTPSCATGTCRVTCSAGLGNCDANPRDCETALNSLANCGGCGVTCSIPNAGETCATGSCRVAGCEGLFGDCNMDGTSCETPLTSLANCGGCGDGCAIPNATPTCASGACRVATCNATYADCDLNGTDCERRTNTLTDCGGCGTPCDIPNATETCTTGSCRVTACSAGWGDCNMDGTSCETELVSNANCGMCGRACNIMNATENCAAGVCNVTACSAGYADCDGDDVDCEPLNASPNCGACGTSCGAGQMCCGSGVGACIATNDDEDNCGGCGVSCGMGETCMGGRCVCGNDMSAVGGGEACTGATPACCDPSTPSSPLGCYASGSCG